MVRRGSRECPALVRALPPDKAKDYAILTLPTPDPDSLETNVIISRDGRSALRVMFYENHDRLLARESRDAVAMYFTVQLVPKEDESRLRVVFSGYFWGRFEPSWIDLDDIERADAIMQIALTGIGNHLDVQGMPPHTPSGVSPASVEMHDAALDKDQKPATDQEVFNYVAAKIYWGWKFGLDKTRFALADRLRLNVPSGDIERVAIRGNGLYWEPSEEAPSANAPAYMTYSPTATRLDDFESGRLPGQSASPIFQVQEKLSAPRYAAGHEHFTKAVANITSPTPDWPNAAKEAVHALESVAKVVTGQPNATLGDAIKKLRDEGQLPPPLDKIFEGIWGFASSTPGIRHGGTTPPDIPESQASFVVNGSAAAILYLLEIDK